MNELKHCPFCGHSLDIDDDDTVYPSGTGWRRQEGGWKSYHFYLEVPKEQWCYRVICNPTNGGCGASVDADSEQQAIRLWNTRKYGE